MEWVGIFISDDWFRFLKCLAFVPLALFGSQLLIECGWFFFRVWGSAIYLYLYNLFACVLVPFRKNVVGYFVLYTKTLYRFAMRQRLGLILEIKSLYNKGCISTKEASFIVFDLHFISKSSLLYIMIMFKFSGKGTNFIL